MALSERQHYRGSRKLTRQRERGSLNPLPMHQNLSYKRLETNPIETLSTFEIYMKTKINESNMSNHMPPLRESDHSRRMSIGQTLPSLINHDGISTDISHRKTERETALTEEKKMQRKNSQHSSLRKLMQQPTIAKSHQNYRAKSIEKFGNTLQKIGAQAQSTPQIPREQNFSTTPPNVSYPIKPSSESLQTSKHELKIRRTESLYNSTGINNNNDSTTRNAQVDTQLIAYDSMKSFYANMSNGNLTSNREYLDKKEFENEKKQNIDLTEITDDYQMDKQESAAQKAFNEKLFAPVPALPKFMDNGVEINSIERLQILDSFRSRKAPNSHRNKSTFHSKRPSILPSDVVNSSQASILNSSMHHVKKPTAKSKQLNNMKGDYLPDWLGQRKDFQEACKNLVTQTKQIVPIACSKPNYSRTIEEIESITIFLLKIKVFRSLPRKIVETISEKVKLKVYHRNEALCHQGDQGDCLYIIFSGMVRCLVDGVQVAVYKAGDTMGQTALDGATPRTATLVAVNETQILRLESEDYKFTMEYYALKQRDDFLSTLKKVKIFEDMDSNKQTIIVAALASKYYTKGEVIYNEGGNAEALYILRKGKVQLESCLEVGKENLWPAGTNLWEKLIIKRNAKFSHVVETNHFFGEIEILKNCKRLHSAVCVEDCQVLILSKRDFFGLLDPDDMAKAKYLVKDTLLQDPERMRKKVIETENQKKKMKEVMIRALSDQLSSLNNEALKKRSKNLVEPGIQRVSQNLKSFIKNTTINAIPRYEIVHSNLE